jgi:hypothetical protein
VRKHRPGLRVPINEKPGTAAFMVAYKAALAEEPLPAADPEPKRPPLPPRYDKQGYVYFLRCGGRVKIGFSKNPWSHRNSKLDCPKKRQRW